MTPVALFILITISSPCVIGLFLIHWQAKSHLNTRSLVQEVDTALSAPMPMSIERGQSHYSFPPTALGFLEDYAYTQKIAEERWDLDYEDDEKRAWPYSLSGWRHPKSNGCKSPSYSVV